MYASRSQNYSPFRPSADGAEVNNTYSIDLTKSWTNTSVVLNQITKTAPFLSGQVLWADEERATFYSWGGAESAGDWYPSDYQDNLPTTAIWQFSPNGDIGSWSEVGDDADSGLKNLVRPAYGSGASGNGAGYLYGGYLYEENNASIDRSYSDAPVPGLISYDFRQNK